MVNCGRSPASSRLGADIEVPYGRGRGGPGGWWIVDEPEIHFVLDTDVTVPDIAGWRKECVPSPPEGHKIQVVPDWICEIFSPSTKSTDREEKMPLYACHGVRFAWLVDPKTHTLEAYELCDADWRTLGIFPAIPTTISQIELKENKFLRANKSLLPYLEAE